MKTRMTIELPDTTAAKLAELAAEEDRTKVEIIRRAIALYAKLHQRDGDSVSVNTPEGSHEIVFL